MNKNNINVISSNSNTSNYKRLNTLSEDITNLIDSNKTITRISSVIKELIENSIDANSKNISIFIKDGGLSLIEIKDDGNGIEKEIFFKLCQRFNSTKMEKYEDIYSLTTFGFRGEALSILSYISNLTILSRTENSDFGYEGTFKMGKLANQDGNLRKLTAEKGTVIRVENIFYNNLIRKNYYDKNEETKDVLNLISKYAFHYHKINFSLANGIVTNKIFTTNFQRFTDNNLSNDVLMIKKNLSARIFHQEISDNLNFFDNCSYVYGDDSTNTIESIKNSNPSDINNINLKTDIKFKCFFTKPSANLDKSLLIIFVNNRLIINNNIKKVFDQTYCKYLIKNGNYFAYLDINCPPSKIDVNVKANKSEVLFMNEEKFLMQLKYLLENNLNEEISSKNYYVGQFSNFSSYKKREEVLFSQSDTSDREIFYAKDKVRVDTKTVMIEKFLANMGKIQNKEREDSNSHNYFKYSQNEFILTIHNELFDPKEKNKEVTEIIRNNYYVGFDCKNYLTFAQFNTSLYLMNTKLLMEEYFLYLLTKGENDKNSSKSKSEFKSNSNFIKSLRVKSNYQISDIFKFVEDNFTKKANELTQLTLETCGLNIIYELIREKIPVLEAVNININSLFQIEEIVYIDLFDNISDTNNKVNFKKNFLCYVPMIYYSVIEALLKFYKKEDINSSLYNLNKSLQNENLNFILAIFKIIAHYNSNYYIEFLCNLEEEERTIYLRDYVISQIKKDTGFFIRKNLREESVIEKIVDTETLYSVFERC